MSTIPVRKRRARSESQIDETIGESFPASDPPSYSGTIRPGGPSRGGKPGRDDDGKEADQTGGKDSQE